MKEYKYKINGNEYAVCINEVNDTTANVTVNGEEYKVEWEKPKEEKKRRAWSEDIWEDYCSASEDIRALILRRYGYPSNYDI